MMQPDPPRRIVMLADRQGWRCIWCEFQMARNVDDAYAMAKVEWPWTVWLWRTWRERFALAVRVSFEHVVPRAEGGTDALSNGLAACRWCNNFRGTEDAKLFKERVTALVQRGEHPRQIYRLTGRWPDMPRKGAIGNRSHTEAPI